MNKHAVTARRKNRLFRFGATHLADKLIAVLLVRIVYVDAVEPGITLISAEFLQIDVEEDQENAVVGGSGDAGWAVGFVRVCIGIIWGRE